MLSVVIPAHDAARWIGDALASVHAQPVHLPVEVVVVTDRCCDNTAAIARAAGARVIDSPAPGAAAARNAGVDASHGAFIAFLDADDLWPADSLGDRLALLESVPEASLVFGDCRQFDDDGHGMQRPHRQTLFESGGLDAGFFGHPQRVIDPLTRLLDAGFITTGSVIIRREAFLALGGFDPTLALVEDLDLWLRAALRHTVLWHPALALLRRRHGANLSRDAHAMARAHIAVLERVARLPEASAHRARIAALRGSALRGLARQEAAAHPLQALGHLLQSLRP